MKKKKKEKKKKEKKRQHGVINTQKDWETDDSSKRKLATNGCQDPASVVLSLTDRKPG